MEEVKAYKIITSIHKLPLESFIDCLVDHDYSKLVIDGQVAEPLLMLAWNDIVNQYNDALSDDNQKQYTSAYQRYQKAKSRHDLAVSYIELLNNYFVRGIVVNKWIRDLNKLVGAKYKFELDKKDEFFTYLENCKSRNASNLVNYQLAEMELSRIAELSNITKKDVKTDRGYFTEIMVSLKNEFEREIPYTISTYEFCVLVNQRNQRYKYYEEQKQKSKR